MFRAARAGALEKRACNISLGPPETRWDAGDGVGGRRVLLRSPQGKGCKAGRRVSLLAPYLAASALGKVLCLLLSTKVVNRGLRLL